MTIQILEEYCKGCGYCIEICPKKVLVESDILNKKGYFLPKVDPEISCTLCKQCELICPEMAITVEKED
ncbi:MAG: ferredoxin family protein [Candidatus Hermodarchaeota archaeon]